MKTFQVTIPSLGPSWVPKLGALFGLAGAIAEVMPPTLPGASVIKPWGLFLGSAGVAIIGFSARQTNVTSEQMGKTPVPNPDATIAPNPPKA